MLILLLLFFKSFSMNSLVILVPSKYICIDKISSPICSHFSIKIKLFSFIKYISQKVYFLTKKILLFEINLIKLIWPKSLSISYSKKYFSSKVLNIHILLPSSSFVYSTNNNLLPSKSNITEKLFASNVPLIISGFLKFVIFLWI